MRTGPGRLLEEFRERLVAIVRAVIDGLQLAYPKDDELLKQGMVLFDSLFRSFEQSARSVQPAGRHARRKPAASRRGARS